MKWQKFINRFHKTIVRAVHRVARRNGDTNPDTREDLTQDVYLKLWRERHRIFKELPRDREGANKYIHVVATNLAIDRFRAQKAKVHGGEVTHTPLGQEEGLLGRADDRGAVSMIERAVLLGEIARFLKAAGTSERDCQIFWFYYRHGMTAREIGILPWIGLTTEGVESVIHKLTVQVRGFVAGTLLTANKAQASD